MKRSYLTPLLLLFIMSASGQYATEYGNFLSPRDTLFVLNIFVDINYDLCPGCDPFRDRETPDWPAGIPNTINQGGPVYLDDFMDHEFDPAHMQGRFTRRFAEASFNSFIVLGDFVVVNIPQSAISDDSLRCNKIPFMNAVIDFINSKGGLATRHGFESIGDYDRHTAMKNDCFLPKNHAPNGKIDLYQFIVRNSTRDYVGVPTGGQTTPFPVSLRPLLIGGELHSNDRYTIQGAMNKNLATSTSQRAEVHELAHGLFGSNSMHMGGGEPYFTGSLVTLSFNNGGWSLIGSASSSLISCNGFERWRLNWRGPDNLAHRIACQNMKSDLVQDLDEEKTFYLRDFVTTGDAIRIRLPYTDPGALPQFIWLENHQIHANGREDYPTWWDVSCKDDGLPGIYAYYQVGKNDTAGNIAVLDPPLTDHLVPISAEGKWDVRKTGEYRILDCVNWEKQPVQSYYRENPLSGYNDLMFHFFNSEETDVLSYTHEQKMLIPEKQGVVLTNLSGLGDDGDAFYKSGRMSLGSNPAPVNVVTYHHKRNKDSKTIVKSTKFADNRKIHLSGLDIRFTEQAGGIYKVDVGWAGYDVGNSVLWTGDIVLHERVNLLSGKKITLDQNYTPNQHIRDTVTGVFAGPTYFTCLEHSTFIMQDGSEVELNNLSSFILEPGSTLEINDKALMRVKEGCTLVVKNGASVIIRDSGKIEIGKGAYLCVEEGARIDRRNPGSIKMKDGSFTGINTAVLSECACF